jgi:hypothetical protein
VRLVPAACLVLLLVAGCARIYDYRVEAHNVSDEPIAMDIVRVLPGDERRSAYYTEVMPQTTSIFEFQALTTQGWDRVEARFRRPTDEAWVRREVASGTPARLDVLVMDGHVVVEDAGASDVGSNGHGGGGGASGSPDR